MVFLQKKFILSTLKQIVLASWLDFRSTFDESRLRVYELKVPGSCKAIFYNKKRHDV